MYNDAGVQGCCRAGLAMNQGHMQPPQDSTLSTGFGRRADEVRGQSSQAVSARAAGTIFVEAAKELPEWLGRAKTSLQGRRTMVPGRKCGALAEDGIGAVVEGVERGNHAAETDPEKRALRRSARRLLGSWRLKLCLGKEKAGASKDFRKFFEIVSIGISSPLKNSFGKIILAPKTASAGERPVSFLACAWMPRSTQWISLAQVAAAVHARSVSLRQW